MKYYYCDSINVEGIHCYYLGVMIYYLRRQGGTQRILKIWQGAFMGKRILPQGIFM